MLFSNLHSFHFTKTLQNATALPAHVYRKTNNRRSVNSSADTPYTTITRDQPEKPVRMKTNGRTETSTEFVSSPFPEQYEPVTIEGRSIRKTPEPPPPDINSKVENKPEKNPQPQPLPPRPPGQIIEKTRAPPQRPHLSKRNVWKPGHGTIEKVDKLTGEIVHLAEEFIDNKEIKANSSI